MASQSFPAATQHPHVASCGYNLFLLVAILWLLGHFSTFTMLSGYFLTCGLLFRSPLLSSLEMIYLSSQSESDDSGSTTPCPSTFDVDSTHLGDDCYYKTGLDSPSAEHVEELIPEGKTLSDENVLVPLLTLYPASESSVLSAEVPEHEGSESSLVPVKSEDQYPTTTEDQSTNSTEDRSANYVPGFTTIFDNDCDQPDTIVEYSPQWEIIAEFEREVWGDVVLAIANNGRQYWRKDRKIRAVSPGEVSGLDQWWQVTQPEPVWLHPDYDAEYVTVSSDEEEDVEVAQKEVAQEEVPQEEAPVTQLKTSTQLVMPTQLDTIAEESEEDDSDLEDMDSEDEALYAEDSDEYDSEEEGPAKKPHPLPLTGHWYPGWELHSGVDYHEHIYLTQMANQEYWKARGFYRVAKCTWAVQETPSVCNVIDSGRAIRRGGLPIPELTMTSPEGVTGYLVDNTHYKEHPWLVSCDGLASLDEIAEMDSDEEPEKTVISVPAVIASPVPRRRHSLTRSKSSFYDL
ncbi:hypothetical protein QBC37DRAFT_404331 [Rhypophila decipiens]|uniref:Uncharacterized protein n=1 Tax=Rhypophila decipiens TaxID=261697 RepID=A0AAN6XZD0_9PEZI|nr:hypothetical protein QBC37DRAFT_404331 [Rhypophila decipiens]